jgi:DNA repair protein RadC
MMTNPHEGHRSRLKARFLTEGLDSFSDHNVLELILFYALPRMDTNEIAHALVNRFGSYRAVFEASVEDLCTVPGIGVHAATLIKLFVPVARRYLLECSEKDRPVCDTLDKLLRYAEEEYAGVRLEETRVLLLDSSLRIIDCVKISEGTEDTSEIKTRRLVETAIRAGAPMAVLMHNHPGGRNIPSGEDYEATLRLVSLCETVGIKLLEHLLITSEIVPILHWARSRAGQEALKENPSLQ